MHRLVILIALASILVVTSLPPAPALSAPQDEAIRWNERGLELTKDGRHLEAVNAFRRALTESPEDATIRRNLALARSNLAVDLLADGRVEDAEHHAALAYELQKDDPIIALNLAACREELGFPAQAAVLIRAALVIGPKDPVVRERMGTLLYREGRLEEAVGEWEKARELGSSSKKLRERLERGRRALAVEKKLSRQLSAHFEVLHDATTTVLASMVLRELEDAHRIVGADIQNRTERPVKVVLLSTEQFREATGAHQWVAGLYDGQIRLPLKGAATKQKEVLARARHEYVHAALSPLGKRAPSWLHEGLAQIHEGRTVATARERTAGRPALEFERLSRSFAATPEEGFARSQYDTALAFVAWLRSGERGSAFRLAIDHLFGGEKLGEAFHEAYGAQLEKMYETFQAELRRSDSR